MRIISFIGSRSAYVSIIYKYDVAFNFLDLESTTVKKKREVILYWGQNSAPLTEKPLRYFCQKGTYDIIVVNYVVKFFASNTRLPGLNLAIHCSSIKYDNNLFRCDVIGSDIKFCQSRGIKVILGFRSESGSEWFQKQGDGKELAKNVWNLFLGGTHSTRPFRDAVFDGISLSVHVGNDDYYDEMIQEINKIYAQNKEKKYYIFVTTTCNFPPPYFKSVIETTPDVIDGVFIKYSVDVQCHPNGLWFEKFFKLWQNNLQNINTNTGVSLNTYLVVAMDKYLDYKTPFKDFDNVYKSNFNDDPYFKGIVLDDANWDDTKYVKPQNKPFSEIVHNMFTPSTPDKTPSTTPKLTTKTTTTQKIYKHLGVGVFWGTNSAFLRTKRKEKSLYDICSTTTSYNTIIINTLDVAADDDNKGDLPGLNFANHCQKPFNQDYKSYLTCPKIGSDIKYCQSKGVKVLLNIGASKRYFQFLNRDQAEKFATLVWKLFLGGVEDANSENLPRTFGSTILDGINLELRAGNPEYIIDFVKSLQSIINSKSRKFMLTASPSCIQPHKMLQETFTKNIGAFDHLFINFDDKDCNINQQNKFEPIFKDLYDRYALKTDGPYIWVGLPSSPKNTEDSKQYLERNNVKARVEFIQDYQKFGGIMLNDASWDYENIKDDKLYSEYLHQIWNPIQPTDRVDSKPGDTNNERDQNKIRFGAASKNEIGFIVILSSVFVIIFSIVL